ncbi:MAG: cobyrinate a,c-diamide synthase [Alphaproteobacteria bacterium]
MAAPGLVTAAAASGAGKTLVTLGLIGAFVRQGMRVAPFKVGPDYIDPAFLAAAAGRPCVNLDGWAMRAATLDGLIAGLGRDGDLIVGEGVMGLFDGGPDGAGSTADLAARTGWPVVLIVDAKGMGASAAALVAGFACHRPDVTVAGVVFNRVGGARHAALLAEACRGLDGIAVLGAVPSDSGLALPSRHLGLVQAAEHPALDDVVARAADLVARHVDLAGLRALARPARPGRAARPEGPADAPGAPPRFAPPRFVPPRFVPPQFVPPLGQRIALAADTAFAFAYPAQIAAWRAAGVEIATFSPLADEAPANDADAVVLPGGYPELDAGRLAANGTFLAGLRRAAASAVVYGECGGYMVLGQALIDAAGAPHAMAGLLPVVTSFAERRLHLGYRTAVVAADGPFGPPGTVYRGHEFHYATATEAHGAPLFHASDAAGRGRGPAGAVAGRVCGSFLHLVDLHVADRGTW